MKYVYAKDDEGFVRKVEENAILADEHIISETEYRECSGEDYYDKHFAHNTPRNIAVFLNKTSQYAAL